MVSRAPRWAIAYKYPPEQVETVVEDIVPYVGPHRNTDPGGAPDAGQGRRLDRRAGDAAQPRRGAPQGRAHRRPGRAPQGGRRHPRDRARRSSSDATGAEREFEMPADVPGVRHADRAGRGRGAPLLPEPGSARRESARSSAISSAAARWTSRAPAGRCSSSCSSAAWSSTRGDFFRLSVEDLESLDRFARKSAENLYASIQRARVRPLYRIIYGAGHPPGGRADGDRHVRPGSRRAGRRATDEADARRRRAGCSASRDELRGCAG